MGCTHRRKEETREFQKIGHCVRAGKTVVIRKSAVLTATD